MNPQVHVRFLFVVAAFLFGIVAHVRAEVVVEPPGATVAGKTIAQWSTNWWRWGLSFGLTGNPFNDPYGGYANANQSGPVFFLAGSGTGRRWFEVPLDTYVLVPLLVGEYSQLELGFDKTSSQIRDAARQQADQIDSLHATLDGVPVPDTTLFAHRELSPEFDFVASLGNQLGVPPGASGIAVADGYFLMLDPLPPGVHVLTYGGRATAFGVAIDETDTITVGAPKITTQPTNQTVTAGQTVNISVGATGAAPLTYQWYYNAFFIPTNGLPVGSPLSNAVSSSLTFTATPASAGVYFVTVTNVAGVVASDVAFLTVQPPVTTPLMLTSADVGLGHFGFGITGAPSGSAIIVEISTNLSQWQVLTNFSSGVSNYISLPLQFPGASFFRAHSEASP